MAAEIVASFVRVLRHAGVNVPVGAGITFAEALDLVGSSRRGDVYWAGRSTLINRPEDIPVYDRCFDAFWTSSVGPVVAIAEQPVV
ncbi:MAG TPA: hypothetical protein PKV27_13010, partial [Ilumatobacteraceae bacterium]|nr:hypothetical protein [Ilumatobacteraceae bacterium]